ncbi:MAG TPA: hypothetical protein VLF40_03765 [Candidatus Saccharimonadales bacterium]|nr:hypothetical protein [Candidatus Saccharimonadales bacterium]
MYSTIVIVGPSAIGKTFAVERLMAVWPELFACVRVHTTRPMRTSETERGDRVFVSDDAFERMVQSGELAIHERFAGNRYGYRADDLKPAGRHLITNAPPFFVPKFLGLEGLLVVGLQAPADYSDLLEARMKVRGDSEESRRVRRAFIERDIQDLEALRPQIAGRGKVFEVTDDQTIPTKVIPWILERLKS